MKHTFTLTIWKIDANGEIIGADPYDQEPVTFENAPSYDEAVKVAISHSKERLSENYPVIDCAGYLAILTNYAEDEAWSEKKVY